LLSKAARYLPAQAKRGTPCYMAPELFQDGATHSTKSDLWSLGCVLYECATGRPPFIDNTFNAVVNDILNKEPEPVQGEGWAGVGWGLAAGATAAGVLLPVPGSNTSLGECMWPGGEQGMACCTA
jgi:serine/threonine protein kinase